MENQKNSQVLFFLLGGLALTILNVLYFKFIPLLKINHVVLIYGILYTLEFIFFCFAAKLYIKLVEPKLWFSKGLVVLSVLTGCKILFMALFMYFFLSYYDLFVTPGIKNFFDLLGPLVRGFMIEFVLIAMASKIFETDIFEPTNEVNDKIIDDLN